VRWLVLATLLVSCPAARQLRVFPADKTYPDQCPAIDIDGSEYVQVEVIEAHHHEDHMLVGVGDDARVPDVTFALCHPAPDTMKTRLVCLPGKVYRKLYDRAAGPDGPEKGTNAVAEAFCKNDKCDLGFAMWVTAPDQSVRRWTNCRLAGGLMMFEDPGDPNSSVRVRCQVKDKVDNAVQPRDCYPPY
jgi:hypothetical protein